MRILEHWFQQRSVGSVGDYRQIYCYFTGVVYMG